MLISKAAEGWLVLDENENFPSLDRPLRDANPKGAPKVKPKPKPRGGQPREGPAEEPHQEQ